MAKKAASFAVEFDGVDEVVFALRSAQRELRGTSKQSEIYKVGIRTIKRTALPALRLSAQSGDAPPQARITSQNWKANRDRFPRAELENKAGFFRDKRSRKDAPRFGAIYWGSIKGGAKFGGPAGPWIDRTIERIAPMVQANYQKGLVRLLKDAGLL